MEIFVRNFSKNFILLMLVGFSANAMVPSRLGMARCVMPGLSAARHSVTYPVIRLSQVPGTSQINQFQRRPKTILRGSYSEQSSGKDNNTSSGENHNNGDYQKSDWRKWAEWGIKGFSTVALSAASRLAGLLLQPSEQEKEEEKEELPKTDEEIIDDIIQAIKTNQHSVTVKDIEELGRIVAEDGLWGEWRSNSSRYLESKLKTLLLSGPFFTKKLMVVLKRHFMHIHPNIIKIMMSNFSPIKQDVVDLAITHIAHIKSKVVGIILDHLPLTIDQISQAVAKQFDNVDPSIVKRILYHNVDKIDLFFPLIVEYIGTMPPNLLEKCWEIKSWQDVQPWGKKKKEVIKEKLAEFIEEGISYHTINLDLIHKILFYRYHFAEPKFEDRILNDTALRTQLTPSMLHLLTGVLPDIGGKASYDNGWWSLGKVGGYKRTICKWSNSFHLRKLSADIIDAEKDFQAREFDTFFHAQKAHFFIPEYWFTKLWGWKNEKNVNEYLFPHVKKINWDNLEKEKKYNEKILKEGCGFEQGGGREKLRKRALFLNYALFGNTRDWGSCTANYFLRNMNIRGASISLEDAFKLNGCQKDYQHYKKELTNLEKEYKCLSEANKKGTILLIAVPRDKTDQLVYPAHAGGKRKNLQLKQETSLHKTSDVMNHLQNKPETVQDPDNVEFCLIMTPDAGLTPESGVKVKVFNGIDQARFNQFMRKSETLFNVIKNGVMYEKNHPWKAWLWAKMQQKQCVPDYVCVDRVSNLFDL